MCADFLGHLRCLWHKAFPLFCTGFRHPLRAAILAVLGVVVATAAPGLASTADIKVLAELLPAYEKSSGDKVTVL